KVLVACIENEHHQIGIKMISDVFEMNGWITYFLGSNTPTTDLIAFAKTISPDFIAISLSIYFHLPELEKTIKSFRAVFPETPILVGGQAFRHGGQSVLLKYDKVIYQPDLYTTDLYIKNLNKYG
ncbi:MAG TPA: cobalamin B12-binding domain-containing protein, partial [Flavobacteriaceae bacterium]|nr:cobalamin B12-binding domain-containing protein [Flavobacteriaceae bacterium]